MKSNKYKDYLKRSFIRYSIAIILVIFILFIVFMWLNIEFTTIRTNRTSNQQVSNFFAEQSKIFSNAADQMALNPVIINAAVNPNHKSITHANELLYKFSTSQTIDSVFILINTKGQLCCSNLYKGNQFQFRKSILIQNVIDKLNTSPNKIYSCVSRLDYKHEQNCDLLFAKAVKRSNDIVGYLFFDLKDDAIDNFVRNLQTDSVTVTDRFDNILFTTSRLPDDAMEKFPAGKYKLDWKNHNTVIENGKRCNAQVTVLPESGLQIYTLSSIELQRKIFFYGGVFLAILSIFLIVTVVIITDNVVRRNLRSIDELVSVVETLGQSNINYQIQTQTYDEFQTLYHAFNQLMLRIQKLVENNNKLAEHKRLAEVKHLQSQFNPHFVFNVMQALRYEIVIDPQKASDMVVSFAKLMRYSIYYGSEKVSLQTDIEYLNDYLLLQKMRYNKRLEYTINISENVLSCKIPKLLIQPVVENCLKHGAECTKFIKIRIMGRKIDNELELCVEDNGDGIPADKLNELRESLESTKENPNHIGLYNVHRTIQLRYGSTYGLTIESEYHKGTKVTLKILLDKEDQNV